MGAVFLCCVASPFPGSELLRAFSEAAMVGALADWFAVSALFRHPLGIPIPHTAIIPNNQGRIGRNLGQFIEQNFLVDEVLQKDDFRLAGTAAEWLSLEENRRFLVGRLQAVLPQFATAFEDRDISSLVRESLVDELRKINVAEVTGRVLSALTAGDAHEVILDEVVKVSREFFRRQAPWIRGKVSEVSPWFVPDFVDQKIFSALVDKAEETFTEALNDRDHALRRKIHEAMAEFIEDLKSSADFHERGAHIREILLTNETFLKYISSIRGKIVAALKTDLSRPDSRIARALDSALLSLAQLLLEDEAFRDKANRAVKQAIAAVIGAHRKDISDTIARTVQSWNTPTLVNRLEEQFGKDLQYIRINGTLVGGLVGLVIYALTKFVQSV